MNNKFLLVVLFLLALSGMMIHYRLHNFMVYDNTAPGGVRFDATRFLPILFGFIDTIGVTLLFLSRKTVVYGYLLNGFLVIYGTVLMVHFSIVQVAGTALPPSDWFVKSTLPYIGITWADFFVGKTLYDLSLKG